MNPKHPTEKKFEDHIEQSLNSSGYRSHSPLLYDKKLCLIPNVILDFIQQSQTKTYEKLTLQYGTQTESKLLNRISNEIERRGVIDVLRKGVKDRGCDFDLVYFEPKSGLNIEHQDLYKLNQFSVVRQLKYSTQNENSIDMGLFINGIPIVMMELKNSLTGQTVEHGVQQWKRDRDPKEPLFRFKRMLVYFSVGNEKVSMTTRLSGMKTKFLPYNKGIENPINKHGFMTHYLWEEILSPSSVLDLIENYVHVREEVTKEYDSNKKKVVDKKSEVMIFPRYHQLNVVQRLKSHVVREGVGNNYLIQHTTGSGKSLSIGWLSHLLSSLYRTPSDTKRMFDSIIVVTDRRILDKQIQNTIKQLEQTTGVVCPVDLNSQQLKGYLEQGKSIIITTVQKFPVISQTIPKLKSKSFGVIIDEVHSSQSGETSRHLKMSLSKSVLDEFKEGEGDEDLTDFDEMILNQILSRGKQPHISYFGFSGTPKNKTLEMFGTKGVDGQFRPFDVYSMEQSIYENFTLDVLQNYTTYKRYFKLNKTIEDDKELPSSRVKRMLVNWVDLHPHSIQEKTRIMLNHFVNNTSQRIEGRSRGMVVTRSRLHCVKFKLEFDKQMEVLNLPYRCLVGFSGKVFDKDTQEEYSESSMNGFSENQTSEKLKEPKYRILIVNNKYQTGFDEPLLHTMYVDKKLGGLQCVQTLSRLNRTMSGKTNTFVLDFVNDPDDVQKSFQDYFKSTVLLEETDPNDLYSIQGLIENHSLFSKGDVDDFIQVFYDDNIPNENLQPFLDIVVMNWKELEIEQQEDFRSNVQSFVRFYGYVSQITTFTDIELEKLYIYLRFLYRKLPKPPVELITDLVSSIDLEYFRIEMKHDRETIYLEQTETGFDPIHPGDGGVSEEEKDLLSNIISLLNENFQGHFNDSEDKVNIGRMMKWYKENEEFRKVFEGDNSETNKRSFSDKLVMNLLQKLVDVDLDFYKKVNDPKINTFLKRYLYTHYKEVV